MNNEYHEITKPDLKISEIKKIQSEKNPNLVCRVRIEEEGRPTYLFTVQRNTLSGAKKPYWMSPSNVRRMNNPDGTPILNNNGKAIWLRDILFPNDTVRDYYEDFVFNHVGKWETDQKSANETPDEAHPEEANAESEAADATADQK